MLQCETVAVKVFLDGLGDRLESKSVGELISISKNDKHLLHAYKEIRQEVSRYRVPPDDQPM